MNRAPPLTQLQSTVEATAASPSPSTAPNRPTAEARSLLATAWLRIRRSKIALLSLCVVVAIMLFAILGPLLSAMSGNDPFTSNTSPDVLDDLQTPGLPLPGYMYPSASHWLGVEPGLGRDLFARLASAAGYFGGKTDAIISRIMDLFLAFPHLLLILSLTPILQSRLRDTPLGQGSFLPMASLVIILGFFGWAYLARIVRGQLLSLREREFGEICPRRQTHPAVASSAPGVRCSAPWARNSSNAALAKSRDQPARLPRPAITQVWNLQLSLVCNRSNIKGAIH
ncbi:ABC transporter permease [Arthrobacter sp. KNU-44]|uniref:ABC transporter permease n=1 Tax=unclassified Arthrobacter TaxID=235627 RepID=UPI003F441460